MLAFQLLDYPFTGCDTTDDVPSLVFHGNAASCLTSILPGCVSALVFVRFYSEHCTQSAFSPANLKPPSASTTMSTVMISRAAAPPLSPELYMNASHHALSITPTLPILLSSIPNRRAVTSFLYSHLHVSMPRMTSASPWFSFPVLTSFCKMVWLRLLQDLFLDSQNHKPGI